MTDKTLVGFKKVVGESYIDFTDGKIYFIDEDSRKDMGFIIRSDYDGRYFVSSKLSNPFLQPVYADADGWIDHEGGPCPVDEGTPVEVMFRSGGIDILGGRCLVAWAHLDMDSDIIAFRLHKEETAATPDNIVDTQTILDPTLSPGECVEELRDITCGGEQPQFLKLIRKGIYTGKSASTSPPAYNIVIEGTHVTDFREESPQERSFRLKQEVKQQPKPEPRKCFPASAMGDPDSHAMLLGVNQFIKGGE